MGDRQAPMSYPTTRVNPQYVDKIYGAALLIIVINIAIAYLDILFVKYLNDPNQLENFIWPLNAKYEASLRHFDFSELDINRLVQTTCGASVVGMVSLIIRVGLEIYTPRTVFN